MTPGFQQHQQLILSDVLLSRRLEGAEAAANASFVEARARVMPASGAQWIEVAQARAMYDGPRSPCTQTFGLGLFQMPAAEDMDSLERFFQDRGAPVIHEVSPLADKALLGVLHERGYRPIELSTVLFLPLNEARTETAGNVQVRLMGEDELDLWVRTVAGGWRDVTEFSGQIFDVMRVSAGRHDSLSFLAELDGEPVAAGSLVLHGGVALLAGASTIARWRRRGAQRALLASRLAHAAQAGCDLAMIVTEPASASQRNAERQGFRIAYTRIKWSLGG